MLHTESLWLENFHLKYIAQTKHISGHLGFLCPNFFDSAEGNRRAQVVRSQKTAILLSVSEAQHKLNHLQHFYTPTRIGSNNHVWSLSPTDTWNKQTVVIVSLFTGNRVNGAKPVGSDWHGQRPMVSINLRQHKHVPNRPSVMFLAKKLDEA